MNFDMMIDKIQYKIDNTTCSAQELRLPMFAPIKRCTPSSSIYKDFIANKRKRWVKTMWGEVCIRGSLLTQLHKDILDVIVLCSKKSEILEDNRLFIDFSISEILRQYGDKGTNHKWLKGILEEIMQAVVSIKDSNEIIYYFHIISAMKYNEKGDFAGIILSSEYLEFYQKTIAINYNKEIKNIVAIENSLIKSIVRFFLTHNEINISLDNLLLALGMQVNHQDRYYRKIKQELKENTLLLANFQINFSEESLSFTYKGNSNVSLFYAS